MARAVSDPSQTYRSGFWVSMSSVSVVVPATTWVGARSGEALARTQLQADAHR